MLHAYFDESGHSADPQGAVVAVAGCIAPLENWERFEPDWKRILADFGVSQLHMKQFAHSVGEFIGWEKDETKRRHFLSELFEVIKNNVTAFTGAAVVLDAFRELPDKAKKIFIDPYVTCFQYCVRNAAIQTLNEGEDERVKVIFAHNDFMGRSANIYQICCERMEHKERLGGISFEFPAEMVELQAADLVAYEVRRFVQDGIPFGEPLVFDEEEQPSGVRWPMYKMLSHGTDRTFFNFFTKENFEDWLRRHPEIQSAEN